MSSRDLTYEQNTVMKEYGDNIVVNHSFHRRSFDQDIYGFNRYWVDTPNSHFLFSAPVYHGKNTKNDTKLRVKCWAAIMYKTGITKMNSNPDVVPVEVISFGKPYVVAYLRAVHEYEYSEISEQFNLSESTISQYLSDVAGLRR